jgi:hypothetical protein
VLEHTAQHERGLYYVLGIFMQQPHLLRDTYIEIVMLSEHLLYNIVRQDRRVVLADRSSLRTHPLDVIQVVVQLVLILESDTGALDRRL